MWNFPPSNALSMSWLADGGAYQGEPQGCLSKMRRQGAESGNSRLNVPQHRAIAKAAWPSQWREAVA